MSSTVVSVQPHLDNNAPITFLEIGPRSLRKAKWIIMHWHMNNKSEKILKGSFVHHEKAISFEVKLKCCCGVCFLIWINSPLTCSIYCLHLICEHSVLVAWQQKSVFDIYNDVVLFWSREWKLSRSVLMPVFLQFLLSTISAHRECHLGMIR